MSQHEIEIEPPPPLSGKKRKARPASTGKQQADVIQATPGRPNKFDAKVAREILNRVTAGELLSDICSAPTMPERRTWYRWIEANDGLAHDYARARVAWSEFHTELMLKLAADPLGSHINEHGQRLPLDNAEVQQRRLHIDTLKWMVSKLAPKLYGDKPEPPAEQEEQIVKITRVIVDSPNRAAAVPVPREPSEPLMLTHQPKLPAPAGPLPEAVQTRLRGILERCVPSNRHANPYALWDEVAGVIQSALTEHFGSKTP